MQKNGMPQGKCIFMDVVNSKLYCLALSDVDCYQCAFFKDDKKYERYVYDLDNGFIGARKRKTVKR